MNTAEPIANESELKEVLSIYPKGSKNHLLLVYTLNTGLRISDILKAKAGDSLKGYWKGREQKTNKQLTRRLPDSLRELIDSYVIEHELAEDDWLFYNNRDRSKHISRQAADKIIRNAGEMLGITLSAHSLRKTFGNVAYKSGVYDIGELQELFNHSSSRVTLRYIGITQETVNNKMKGLSIGL